MTDPARGPTTEAPQHTSAAKLHGGAIRDALREAIRTAHRRRLNLDECDLFLSFIDELEVRAKRAAKAGA